MTMRDRYWLVLSAFLAVSGAVSLYHHPITWWQGLVIAAIIGALSPSCGSGRSDDRPRLDALDSHAAAGLAFPTRGGIRLCDGLGPVVGGMRDDEILADLACDVVTSTAINAFDVPAVARQGRDD
jgi:hypothetical protein